MITLKVRLRKLQRILVKKTTYGPSLIKQIKEFKEGMKNLNDQSNPIIKSTYP